MTQPANQGSARKANPLQSMEGLLGGGRYGISLVTYLFTGHK